PDHLRHGRGRAWRQGCTRRTKNFPATLLLSRALDPAGPGASTHAGLRRHRRANSLPAALSRSGGRGAGHDRTRPAALSELRRPGRAFGDDQTRSGMSVAKRIGITSIGSGVGQSVISSCRLARRPIHTIGLGTNPLAFGAYDCDEHHALPSLYTDG